MLEIIGKVSGVFRDAVTGEVTREFPEVENHLQDWFLKDFIATGSNSMPGMGTLLFVSAYNPQQQTRKMATSLDEGVNRFGVAISGVPAKQVTYNNTPGVHLYQVVMRFAPPTTDFTFHSAGLCRSNTGNRANSITNFVWLNVPCTQLTTETLDLYYRVHIRFNADYSSYSQDNKNLLPFESLELTKALCTESHIAPLLFGFPTFHGFCYTAQNKINSRQFNTYYTNNSASWTNYQQQLILNDVTKSPIANSYKYKLEAGNELAHNIGVIATHVGVRSHYLCSKILSSGESPIQSIFAHRSTSLKPFYEASSAALGLGAINVNGLAWTDPDCSKYFKVDITSSGINGVGQYKFRVSKTTGFAGNTFYPQLVALHWTNSDSLDQYQNFEFIDSDKTYAAYPVEHSANEVIYARQTELIKCNIHTAVCVNVNNTTLFGADVTPRFVATKICQVEVSPSLDTFVACRNTGLYRLNSTFTVMDVLNNTTPGLENTTGCYGVHIGMGGRVWAYFAHSTADGLYYSDDNGANWTKTTFAGSGNGFTTARIAYIHADTNNHHVGVFHIVNNDFSTINNDIGVQWWNNDTATSTPGYNAIKQTQTGFYGYQFDVTNSMVLGYQRLVTCSPNQSVWGCASPVYNDRLPMILTFGSAAYTGGVTTGNLKNRNWFTNWTVDAAGNDAFAYISALNNGGAGTDGYYHLILSQDLTTYEAYHLGSSTAANLINVEAQILLSSGLWLTTKKATSSINACISIAAIVPYNETVATHPAHYAMYAPEYGWNGSAWVQGEVGAKTVHAASEELLEGITISFDDISGSTAFLDSDHYTFSVVDGIMFDGFTATSFMWNLYGKPSLWSTQAEAANLPATTKVPNVLLRTTPTNISEFTDVFSTTVASGGLVGTGTSLVNDYNAGARSINPVITTTLSPFAPNAVQVPGTDIRNAQGYIQATLRSSGTSGKFQHYIGLSTASVLGTPIGFATMDYAMHVDTEGYNPGDGSSCRIRILEKNVEVAVIDNIEINAVQANAMKIRMVLLNTGAMVYLYENYDSTSYYKVWTKLYQSPPGTVTETALHLDVYAAPVSNYGLESLEYYNLDGSQQDYYTYMGNGLNTGVHAPTFILVDSDSVKLTINGTEAVKIADNDASTVLAANSYSVFPASGVIRYSASDVGLPYTIEYVALTDE